MSGADKPEQPVPQGDYDEDLTESEKSETEAEQAMDIAHLDDDTDEINSFIFTKDGLELTLSDGRRFVISTGVLHGLIFPPEFEYDKLMREIKTLANQITGTKPLKFSILQGKLEKLINELQNIPELASTTDELKNVLELDEERLPLDQTKMREDLAEKLRATIAYIVEENDFGLESVSHTDRLKTALHDFDQKEPNETISDFLAWMFDMAEERDCNLVAGRLLHKLINACLSEINPDDPNTQQLMQLLQIVQMDQDRFTAKTDKMSTDQACLPAVTLPPYRDIPQSAVLLALELGLLLSKYAQSLQTKISHEVSKVRKDQQAPMSKPVQQQLQVDTAYMCYLNQTIPDLESYIEKLDELGASGVDHHLAQAPQEQLAELQLKLRALQDAQKERDAQEAALKKDAFRKVILKVITAMAKELAQILAAFREDYVTPRDEKPGEKRGSGNKKGSRNKKPKATHGFMPCDRTCRTCRECTCKEGVVPCTVPKTDWGFTCDCDKCGKVFPSAPQYMNGAGHLPTCIYYHTIAGHGLDFIVDKDNKIFSCNGCDGKFKTEKDLFNTANHTFNPATGKACPARFVVDPAKGRITRCFHPKVVATPATPPANTTATTTELVWLE